MSLKDFFIKILNFFKKEPSYEKTGKITFQKSKRPKKPDNCQYNDCKKELKGVDAFYCKYCKRWYCKSHRLPKHHDCGGNPKAPPGGYRGVYEGGQWKVYGK